MTAKEMFEDLGYELIEDNKSYLRYADYVDEHKYAGEMIDFDKDHAEEFCKLYDLTLSDVVDGDINKDFTISPAKLQALCMENIDKSFKKN